MRVTWLIALGVCLGLGCTKSETTPADSNAGSSNGGASAQAGAGAGGGGASAGGAGGMAEGGAAGDSLGGSGGDAGAAGAAGDEPLTLFDTGLYADAAMTQLAEGVMEYTPQFALWSDTAEKRRFIWLPPGTQIDTADMDYWMFPVGTKVWKEFSRDGTRIETRLLQKLADDDWLMVAYAWTADLTATTLVPTRGEEDALGTAHNIPSRRECDDCHKGQTDYVLGFSAIQLSHDGSAVNLASLKTMNLLTMPPVEDAFILPGNALEQAAIGMMHANCGQCHSQFGSGYDRNQMELWLTVDSLSDLALTAPYQTAVGVVLDQDLSETLPGITHRVIPGAPEQSALYLRMNERDEERLIAMPPIGTELLDTDGLQLVTDWINALPPIADAGADGG